jgi:hypothetical protein
VTPELVAGAVVAAGEIPPGDDREAADRRTALDWLASTDLPPRETSHPAYPRFAAELAAERPPLG